MPHITSHGEHSHDRPFTRSRRGEGNGGTDVRVQQIVLAVRKSEVPSRLSRAAAPRTSELSSTTRQRENPCARWSALVVRLVRLRLWHWDPVARVLELCVRAARVQISECPVRDVPFCGFFRFLSACRRSPAPYSLALDPQPHTRLSTTHRTAHCIFPGFDGIGERGGEGGEREGRGLVSNR